MIRKFLFINSLALSSGKGRNLLFLIGSCGFANEVSASDKVAESVVDKKIEVSSNVKTDNKMDNVGVNISSNINKTNLDVMSATKRESTRMVNPMDRNLRVSSSFANDQSVINASSNVNVFIRAHNRFFSVNLRAFDQLDMSCYVARIKHLVSAYGVLISWIKLGVDRTNLVVMGVFEKIFSSLRFDSVGFKSTAFFRDNSVRYQIMLSKIGINAFNSDAIVSWVYNLIQNYIVSLINSKEFKERKIIVASLRRYSRNDPLGIGITTTIYGNDDRGKVFKNKYIDLKVRNLRWFNFERLCSFNNRILGYIISNINLECSEVDVTTYNVETGSMIMLAPNNPRPGEVPIVTHNINVRIAPKLAFTVSSLKQVVLLALISKYHERILSNDSYANIFWMHFINEFVESSEANFFNSNFEFNFKFSYAGSADISDVFHITAPNKFESVYDSFSSVVNENVVIESMLYMFDGLDRDISLNHVFNTVSDQDIGLFNSLHIKGAYVVVDDSELLGSTVNAPNDSDFVNLRMIKHYFGSFMPIVINAITLMEDWYNADNATKLPELYTSGSLSWSDFISSILTDFVNSDVYCFSKIVTHDSYPVFFALVNVVNSRVETTKTQSVEVVQGRMVNPMVKQLNTVKPIEVVQPKVVEKVIQEVKTGLTAEDVNKLIDAKLVGILSSIDKLTNAVSQILTIVQSNNSVKEEKVEQKVETKVLPSENIATDSSTNKGNANNKRVNKVNSAEKAKAIADERIRMRRFYNNLSRANRKYAETYTNKYRVNTKLTIDKGGISYRAKVDDVALDGKYLMLTTAQ